MLVQENTWQLRPRKLSDFTADAQVRLRQLDFNRTITVYVENKTLNVRRMGLDKFLWCEAAVELTLIESRLKPLKPNQP